RTHHQPLGATCSTFQQWRCQPDPGAAGPLRLPFGQPRTRGVGTSGSSCARRVSESPSLPLSTPSWTPLAQVESAALNRGRTPVHHRRHPRPLSRCWGQN
ncbi:unnamed protein product, partial [Ectocarpus sp. 12 AP-2014]